MSLATPVSISSHPALPTRASERLAFRRASDAFAPAMMRVAEEVPVAFAYNGVAHAVMMATPGDLEDFAIGFSRAERIIRDVSDVRDIGIGPTAEGIELDIALAPDRLRAFLAERRVRALRGHTSCGLCGVEDLRDVPGSPCRVRAGPAPHAEAIEHAVGALRAHQPLGRETQATHVAAWAARDGAILLAREDVGRHCALDKLVGACLRGGIDVAAGFAVVSSRCSFEMVQKAVAAGMPALVAVAAPTALAIRTAEAAGLVLVASARDGSYVTF